MAIVEGKRSNRAIRRVLRSGEVENIHWYLKTDPDFDAFTYSRCHRLLRRTLRLDDVLFFRTLWRGRPYIIGYFTIVGIVWPKENPVILASKERSPLIHYALPVTSSLVRLLNPRAAGPRTCSFNHWVNARLGRNYMRLDAPAAAYLKALIDDKAAP